MISKPTKLSLSAMFEAGKLVEASTKVCDVAFLEGGTDGEAPTSFFTVCLEPTMTTNLGCDYLANLIKTTKTQDMVEVNSKYASSLT